MNKSNHQYGDKVPGAVGARAKRPVPVVVGGDVAMWRCCNVARRSGGDAMRCDAMPHAVLGPSVRRAPTIGIPCWEKSGNVSCFLCGRPRAGLSELVLIPAHLFCSWYNFARPRHLSLKFAIHFRHHAPPLQPPQRRVQLSRRADAAAVVHPSAPGQEPSSWRRERSRQRSRLHVSRSSGSHRLLR